jgi:hypothetical protein
VPGFPSRITETGPRYIIHAENSQIGAIGDHARVAGGIHLHAAPPPATPTERRNHAAMLQLVRNTWSEGVLKQSIHGAAMLDRGKTYTPHTATSLNNLACRSHPLLPHRRSAFPQLRAPHNW